MWGTKQIKESKLEKIPIDWIAGAILWIGNIILIKYKHWSAFIVFSVANVLWLVYWIYKAEWAAAVLVASFILQNAWGIYSWYRKPPTKVG